MSGKEIVWVAVQLTPKSDVLQLYTGSGNVNHSKKWVTRIKLEAGGKEGCVGYTKWLRRITDRRRKIICLFVL